ncbi:carboxymuconolactone decarboxylase family protein [Mycobacterium paraterrae]|uniref:Carboxymuconolactone decarboxylase family protein n=1 Tax=Mycobacterium paraterrae TaxID=577492 RepID=A0ABY3VQV9_9MYCO|nr:carboxymuconolactone decarboxylase family protein [Mycobacterium paraterrae]UMB69541.1 carboxymuconolactone decarboxylase family protein [Mycobacterium paraterrae]
MAKPQPYRATVAVPLPEHEVAREVVGADYDPLTTLNVMRMMAGTGDMFTGLVGMVRAVFGAEGIDARHREVIILRAAVVLDSPYEWQANEKMAANAGLTPAEIDAIAADGAVRGIADDYVLLCRAADEMYGATHTLADDTLSGLLETFGADLTRKYITTIAWFSLLSLFLNATRVPLETTDKIGDRTSPL